MRGYIKNLILKLCIFIIDKLSQTKCYDQTTILRGYVVWDLMPLTQAELMKIPPGHRVRPFVIISSDTDICYGYACSSHPNGYRSRELQFRIDKGKYHINKSSYVDTTHEWAIPYSHIKSYYYALDEEDIQRLSDTKEKAKEKDENLEVGKGTIIKNKQGDHFLIYTVKEAIYHAYFLKKKPSEHGESICIFL